ncbi:sulfotransferase 6B1-like [Ambystoma mexicanum]|uniref:sulfotransferase 6B1-like n=1 Tax=Ambystoma mexicanum TaxID=8296 RepID=UPI0037E7F95B
MSGQPSLIHTFNGIPFTTRSSTELLKSLDTFQAREDDVVLVSFPKSGTHWLAEIIKHLYASNVTLTSPIEFGELSKLEEMKNLPSRRIIPTHLSYGMLPRDLKAKKCKAIYIVRNPKDTAVSLYHYYRDNPNLPTIEAWPTYFNMFLHGEVVCGSWFDHVLGWEEHKNEGTILILYYESMKKNLPKSIRKISNFLGISITEQEINEVSRMSSFSEMKNNVDKENNDPNHTVCALTSNRKLIFRKGAVGDWKNHFTAKQNRLFDDVYESKMESSALARRIKYE